jgi:hypothetical protein
MRAADVLERGCGDAQGKASLLRALLAVAGIESRLVAVETQAPEPAPYPLPSPLAPFDHVVLAVGVGGGEVFCDPSAPHAAFGQLPPNVRGRSALPVDARGAQAIVTPEEPAGASLARVEAALALSEDGSASGRVAIAGQGDLAMALYGGPRGPARLAEADWQGTFVDPPQPPAVPGEVMASATLHFPALTDPIGARREIPLAKLFLPVAIALPEGRRRLPLVLPPTGAVEQTVRIALPRGAKADVLPKPESLTAGPISYRLAASAVGNIVEVTRRFEVRSRLAEPELYDGIREAMARIAATEDGSIALSFGGRKGRRR